MKASARQIEEMAALPGATVGPGVNLPVVRLDVAAAAHPGQRVSLTLPWPPSVNHYWRSVVMGGSMRPHVKVLISEKGREYRNLVALRRLALGPMERMNGRLSIFISAFPPDKRRFDLDNRLKALLDAMTHAGIWNDDEQIDHLSISRRDVVAGGRVEVLIIPRKEVPQ